MNNKHELHVIIGTGPLGQSVMRALREKGHTNVRMVNRSGKRHPDIPVSIEIVASDAYNVDQVEAVTQGAAVVYQCAQPGYTQWPEKFPPLQRAILEGSARNGAVLVVGDNLYMYGDTDGAPIHEGLPYKPHGHKTRTRAQMATEILEAHASGKIKAVIGRGSDFYGEGVKGALLGELVFDNIMQGKAAQTIGNPDLLHTQTYIGDFGRGLVILGENESAWGEAWHIPNAPTVTTREVLSIIEEEMGQPIKVAPMPKLMFEVLSLVHPMLREYREMRYELEKPYIVDHSKFVAAFGDIHTPLREGIRNTTAWYRSQLEEKIAA